MLQFSRTWPAYATTHNNIVINTTRVYSSSASIFVAHQNYRSSVTTTVVITTGTTADLSCWWHKQLAPALISDLFIEKWLIPVRTYKSYQQTGQNISLVLLPPQPTVQRVHEAASRTEAEWTVHLFTLNYLTSGQCVMRYEEQLYQCFCFNVHTKTFWIYELLWSWSNLH